MSQLYRIRTGFTGAGGLPGLNVTHWTKMAGGNPDGAVGRIEDFWNGEKGLLTNLMTVQVDPEIDVIDEATGGLIDVLSSTTVTIEGTNDAAPLPWEVQALAKASTPTFLAGRRLRGRMFIPGLCVDSLAAGHFSDANRGDTATRWAAMIDPGLDAEYVVYSTVHHLAAAASSSGVNQQFSVLRSRRD